MATIRPFTESDKPTFLTLWSGYNTFYKRTISDTVTKTTISRFLDSSIPMFCAVAEDEAGTVIGFATWYPHMSTSSVEPAVYLNDLFVAPDTRSRGTGGKLIDYVEKHAREVLGAASLYWLTQHFNHAAQLLYVKKATKSDFVHYSKRL